MHIFDPSIQPITVDEMYGDWPISEAEVDALLNRSLRPRGASMLYDKMAVLGVQPDHTVLDIGCRDAAHTCRLAERLGCNLVGVEPVDRHIREAIQLVQERGLADRIAIHQGAIEAIPLEDASVDYIWCRDMLTHLLDLGRGLAECRRVLRAGGQMLVYQTLATPLIEPREAAWLYAGLAVVPANMDPAYFEKQAQAVGFRIVERDPVDSEWREKWEEEGIRTTSKQLLQIARMRRDRDRLLSEMGRVAYTVELANSVWGVFQMLGKLCPTVYVLQ